MGGRGLESSLIEGAERAGGDGRDREQTECRERAQDQREQQQDGETAGPGLGGSPASGARVECHALEGGEERGAVPEMGVEGSAQRSSGIAPALGASADGVDRARPQTDRAMRRIQGFVERCRRPSSGDRERSGQGEAGAGREAEQIDEVGEPVDHEPFGVISAGGTSPSPPAGERDRTCPGDRRHGSGEQRRGRRERDGADESVSGPVGWPADGRPERSTESLHPIGVRAAR